MKIVKPILLLSTVLVCFGCSNLPGTAGSRYSLEGYNNAGYSGDYPRQGGYDDTSLEEAKKERERIQREAQENENLQR